VARATSVSVDSSTDALREQAQRDLDALIQAAALARKDLRAYQHALEKNARHLAAGGRVSDLNTLCDVSEVRSALTARLNHIERARSTSRLSLWRLQLTEGTTIAEIARAWGFSRQLVSRALAGRSPELSKS
jgi:hypothetical protein